MRPKRPRLSLGQLGMLHGIPLRAPSLRSGEMATRHDSYSLSQATHAAELPRTTALEPLLRRFAGDGIVNLFRARAEVLATLRASGDAVPPAPPLPDALPAQSIPSVAGGRYEDRVLAEIDQDGYAFAAERIDEPYFNRRAHRRPRQMNLIDIALVDGHVCVRKRFRGFRVGARRWGDRPVPPSEWAYRSLWVSLGFFLYSEAAALLRMHDLPSSPSCAASTSPSDRSASITSRGWISAARPPPSPGSRCTITT